MLSSETSNLRRHSQRRLRLGVPILLSLALVAAACGGDDDESDSSSATAATTAAESTATTEAESTATTEAESTDTTEADSTATTEAESTATTEAAAAESGPGTPAPQPLPETEDVVLVYSVPIEAWANVLLADEFGEWEKENLNVRIEVLGGPDGSLLLSQGKADVQLVGISASVFNAVASGQPVTYVASSFTQDAPLAGFWIHKDYTTDGQPDPEKIKGSQVMPGTGGGGFGNPGALPLWNWMQEVGLTADDVQTITVNSGQDSAQILINGNASISLGLTPHWAAIEESGCCDFLVPTVVSGSFLANTDFLADRPEVAEAFFRALVRTNRTYLQGDYHADDAVVEAISKQSGATVEQIRAGVSLGFDPDLAIVTRDVLPDFQDQFRAFDLLAYDDDLTADDMIDTSPVDAVVAGG